MSKSTSPMGQLGNFTEPAAGIEASPDDRGVAELDEFVALAAVEQCPH